MSVYSPPSTRTVRSAGSPSWGGGSSLPVLAPFWKRAGKNGTSLPQKRNVGELHSLHREPVCLKARFHVLEEVNAAGLEGTSPVQPSDRAAERPDALGCRTPFWLMLPHASLGHRGLFVQRCWLRSLVCPLSPGSWGDTCGPSAPADGDQDATGPGVGRISWERSGENTGRKGTHTQERNPAASRGGHLSVEPVSRDQLASPARGRGLGSQTEPAGAACSHDLGSRASRPGLGASMLRKSLEKPY